MSRLSRMLHIVIIIIIIIIIIDITITVDKSSRALLTKVVTLSIAT